LPEGDADFPGRWRAIKKGFSKFVRIGEPRSPAMIRRGERGIWQRRYWEHTIRDAPRLREGDLAADLDYIHFNPVKHGLVEHPAAERLAREALNRQQSCCSGHEPDQRRSPSVATYFLRYSN
jgi:REP element-mobilizing transposase RayT